MRNQATARGAQLLLAPYSIVLNFLPSMKTNEDSALQIDVLHTNVGRRARATMPLSPGPQRNAAEQGATRRLLRADKLCSNAGQLHGRGGAVRMTSG